LDQINARKKKHIKIRKNEEENKELLWVRKLIMPIKKYLRGN
jgi:hypothetical protein